jgi:hypothetical protein
MNPRPDEIVSILPCDGSPARNPSEADYGFETLPDYLTDLNAMHEAEKVLDENQWRTYGDLLVAKIKPYAGPGLWNHRHVHATPAQRAEAFLRTLGKWDDSK